MKCEYCDNEIPLGFVRCPSCGGSINQTESCSVLNFDPNALHYVERKNRNVYALLGVFFGVVGGHDLYAGYTTRVVVHVLLVIFIPIAASFADYGGEAFLLGGMLSWGWGILESVTVRKDSKGIAFE